MSLANLFIYFTLGVPTVLGVIWFVVELLGYIDESLFRIKKKHKEHKDEQM